MNNYEEAFKYRYSYNEIETRYNLNNKKYFTEENCAKIYKKLAEIFPKWYIPRLSKKYQYNIVNSEIEWYGEFYKNGNLMFFSCFIERGNIENYKEFDRIESIINEISNSYFLKQKKEKVIEIFYEAFEISKEKRIIKGTSCYENAEEGNLVSITGDGGNAWGFYGNSYKKLAPRLTLWQYYDKNPDNLSEEQLIDWYIKEFYELRLKDLNVYELLNTLENKFGDDIILLCHELPGAKINKEYFCHRRLIADWIELETGLVIPEISIDKDETIEEEKVYDLKPKIKNLIKNS